MGSRQWFMVVGSDHESTDTNDCCIEKETPEESSTNNSNL
jgi:hypothetical protein